MAWKFEIGMDVVCLAPEDGIWMSWRAAFELIKGPKKGDVLKITGFDVHEGILGLKFAEWPGGEGYHSEAFRPVHKTDISVFEQMLAPAPGKVKEDA